MKNIFWLLKNRNSIKNWKKRNFLPPSPEFIKEQILINNNLNNSLWIETGTYYGKTTKVLANISKKIFTIEADERLYDLAIKKFKNKKNVKILKGKSEELLENILQSNSDFKNLCIYLDAHLCQDHLTNKSTFGKIENETPIRLELKYIENNIKNFDQINLLIDDIRLFASGFQNYPDKDYLTDWCKKNKFKWDIQQDIFIAKHLKN